MLWEREMRLLGSVRAAHLPIRPMDAILLDNKRRFLMELQTGLIRSGRRTPLFREYGGHPTHLPYYAVLIAGYLGFFAAGAFAARKRRKVPERIDFSDLLLIGVASHKISRFASKDRITAPLRAPFTKYVKSTGASEVEEVSRGAGMRGAVGELVTCPFCMSSWTALGLVLGFAFKPRITRLFCSTMAAITISNVLHHLYSALKEKTDHGE
jgi:hypothetical protein